MLDKTPLNRLVSSQPHLLHHPERAWPETNCYVDLWIEVLAARGYDPLAALGFTFRQDFEGDQFTFFKFPLEDLEALYGISVQELAVFDTLESHLMEQIQRGRLPLVEVDGHYLPDTDGVSYRLTHPKTTIAVTVLEPQKRRMEYFHNSGYFTLEGEDYDGVFRKLPHQNGVADALFPYTEFAKFYPERGCSDLASCAIKLARHHFRYRPQSNPVAAFRAAFPAQALNLAARDPEYFHIYAFNTLRQLGANFGLMADHLAWLGREKGIDFKTAIGEAGVIANGAKSFQFQLARAMARGRLAGLEAQLDPLVEAYDRLFYALEPTLRS